MSWKLQASCQTRVRCTKGEGLQGVCEKTSTAKGEGAPAEPFRALGADLRPKEER